MGVLDVYRNSCTSLFLCFSIMPIFFSLPVLAGLRMINVGEVYVPAEILAQEEQVTRTGRHWLTGRERDVLNGLLSGQSNKEIARTHGLSEVTIKHHLKSLRSKLGARNRTHAVCRAIELGIAEDAGSVMSYSTA